MADVCNSTSTSTAETVRRATQIAQGAPSPAAQVAQALTKVDPAQAAKDNETRVAAARSKGVMAPKATQTDPPLPPSRPATPASGVSDIKLNPRRPMQEGSGMGQQRTESKDVKTMQARLQDLGFSVGRHTTDGKYGRDTAAGVKEFQKANGLPESGKLDKATWDKMRSDKAVKKEVKTDAVAGSMLDPSSQPGFYAAWDKVIAGMPKKPN